MPTVFMFNGYKVNIYYDDHGVPHIHLLGADAKAVISILTGEILDGDAPKKPLETVRSYIEENKDFLLAEWSKRDGQ